MIVHCEKHDREFDSDLRSECWECEQENDWKELVSRIREAEKREGADRETD